MYEFCLGEKLPCSWTSHLNFLPYHNYLLFLLANVVLLLIMDN